jgi:formiminotetrahydrofolate cyclodeaminase
MKLMERDVESLLAELGSDSPAPGGGSAAALAGAMAASLCAMVCRLTLARKSLEPAWPEMQETLQEAEQGGARLRALVDEDSEAYAAVVAARRLPKQTPAESEIRGSAVAEANLRAASVPLDTLEALTALGPLFERVARRGNPSCASDAATGAALLRAAASGAAWNVRANLQDMADADLRSALSGAASAALEAVEEAARVAESAVAERLKG